MNNKDILKNDLSLKYEIVEAQMQELLREMEQALKDVS